VDLSGLEQPMRRDRDPLLSAAPRSPQRAPAQGRKRRTIALIFTARYLRSARAPLRGRHAARAVPPVPRIRKRVPRRCPAQGVSAVEVVTACCSKRSPAAAAGCRRTPPPLSGCTMFDGHPATSVAHAPPRPAPPVGEASAVSAPNTGAPLRRARESPRERERNRFGISSHHS